MALKESNIARSRRLAKEKQQKELIDALNQASEEGSVVIRSSTLKQDIERRDQAAEYEQKERERLASIKIATTCCGNSSKCNKQDDHINADTTITIVLSIILFVLFVSLM